VRYYSHEDKKKLECLQPIFVLSIFHELTEDIFLPLDFSSSHWRLFPTLRQGTYLFWTNLFISWWVYGILHTIVLSLEHPLTNKLFDVFGVNHDAEWLWHLPWSVAWGHPNKVHGHHPHTMGDDKCAWLGNILSTAQVVSFVIEGKKWHRRALHSNRCLGGILMEMGVWGWEYACRNWQTTCCLWVCRPYVCWGAKEMLSNTVSFGKTSTNEFIVLLAKHQWTNTFVHCLLSAHIPSLGHVLFVSLPGPYACDLCTRKVPNRHLPNSDLLGNKLIHCSFGKTSTNKLMCLLLAHVCWALSDSHAGANIHKSLTHMWLDAYPPPLIQTQHPAQNISRHDWWLMSPIPSFTALCCQLDNQLEMLQSTDSYYDETSSSLYLFHFYSIHSSN